MTSARGVADDYALAPRSHSRTLALSHSRTPALSHSRTLALSHSRTLALSHSRTPALPHSRTPALPHSRTPRTPALPARGPVLALSAGDRSRPVHQPRAHLERHRI